MKKILAVLFAVCTVLTFCACSGSDDPYRPGEGTISGVASEDAYVELPSNVPDELRYENTNKLFSYAVYGRHVEITRYIGSETEVTIPAGIENRPVTVIAPAAFSDRLKVTSVYLPPTVVTIGENAFERCRSLTTVTGCENVVTVGKNAFAYDESLVSFPWEQMQNLQKIENYAFTWCTSLESVTLRADCSIGDYSFRCCSGIKELTFSDGEVDFLGEQAFYGCSSLHKLVYPVIGTSGESVFASCTGLTDLTFEENVTTIGVRAFQACSSLPELTIPQHITMIGGYSFGSCKAMKKVTIQGNMTAIGPHAFLLIDDLTIAGIPGSSAELYTKDRPDGENWKFKRIS